MSTPFFKKFFARLKWALFLCLNSGKSTANPLTGERERREEGGIIGGVIGGVDEREVGLIRLQREKRLLIVYICVGSLRVSF